MHVLSPETLRDIDAIDPTVGAVASGTTAQHVDAVALPSIEMAQVVKALGVTEAAALLVVPRTWLDDNVRRVTFIQVCVAGGATS